MSASSEQLHVLSIAQAGRDCTMVPLVDGKGSQSRTVGRGATVSVCVRNGWLAWSPVGGWRGQGQYELTDAGRAVLAQAAQREQDKRDRALRNSVLEDAGWERGYRCHGLWTCASRYDPNWTPAYNMYRLGRVSLGPPRLWDGTYSWLIDNPSSPNGVPLAEGVAATLKEAKMAVELAVARAQRGLPCLP